MYDYRTLLNIMTEQDISIRELSRITGIATSTLHDKLSGRSEFKASEMILIGSALKQSDLQPLFFTQKVRNNERRA